MTKTQYEKDVADAMDRSLGEAIEVAFAPLYALLAQMDALIQDGLAACKEARKRLPPKLTLVPKEPT